MALRRNSLDASNLNHNERNSLKEPKPPGNSIRKEIRIFVNEKHNSSSIFKDSITYWVNNKNGNIVDSELQIIQFWCPEYTNRIDEQNRNFLH